MSTSTQIETLPDSYTSPGEEYDALTGAVGLVRRSHVGRLELTGEDALDLLNRLSTNKLEDLTPGAGMGSVLTSAKGRIVDLLLVLMLEDRLLLLVGPDARERVAEWIDFFTFTEDVTVRDLTADTAMFSLIGPNAVSACRGVRRRSRGGASGLQRAGCQRRRHQRHRGARRLRRAARVRRHRPRGRRTGACGATWSSAAPETAPSPWARSPWRPSAWSRACPRPGASCPRTTTRLRPTCCGTSASTRAATSGRRS